jgi:TetR/AcrR family tetracycline transcriptional repressor
MGDKKVTKEAVVAEAIALLNEAGLDGVSLRKIAARVGVQAPSLYWHFKDKDALLAALIEQVFSTCLDSVPAHEGWQDWMRAFARALWRDQGTLRDFGRLVTSTQLDTAQVTRTVDHLRRKMAPLDIDASRALHIQSSIQALVTGWSAFAHAPYATKLGIAFEQALMRDVDALIAGKAIELGLAGKRQTASRSKTRPTATR